MKLFKCQHKEDKRDQWYEMQLDNCGAGVAAMLTGNLNVVYKKAESNVYITEDGNKMGIVYRGQGQMEFWGGRLSENAERILLFDTELTSNFETLYDRIQTLFSSAVGEKEYTSEYVIPLWFAIAELMSITQGMKERSPGLFHEHEFKGYAEKFNQQILEAQRTASDIKIIVTGAGENATHTAEGS